MYRSRFIFIFGLLAFLAATAHSEDQRDPFESSTKRWHSSTQEDNRLIETGEQNDPSPSWARNHLPSEGNDTAENAWGYFYSENFFIDLFLGMSWFH